MKWFYIFKTIASDMHIHILCLGLEKDMVLIRTMIKMVDLTDKARVLGTGPGQDTLWQRIFPDGTGIFFTGNKVLFLVGE